MTGDSELEGVSWNMLRGLKVMTHGILHFKLLINNQANNCQVHSPTTFALLGL